MTTFNDNESNQYKEVRIKLGQSGRVIIPSDIRTLLDLKVGDELVLSYEKNLIKIQSYKAKLQEAKQLIRRANPTRKKLTNLLFEMRKEERSK